MADLPLTGGCLCGGVRFKITGPPTLALYCHCTRCQRRTGTSQSAQIRIEGGTFRLLSGEELMRYWGHPDGGQEKGWCGNCGAHLVSRDPEARFDGKMSVRMGALDCDPGIAPTMRVNVAFAASWEAIPEDGLERFDGIPPGVAESDSAYATQNYAEAREAVGLSAQRDTAWAMSQENVDVVRAVYDAAARHDTETALSLYDPDVEFDASRIPETGLGAGAVVRGHDGLRKWFWT